MLLCKLRFLSCVHLKISAFGSSYKGFLLFLSFDLIRHCRIIGVVIFIETSTFSKLLPNYLSDDDYQSLQNYLLQKPDAGDIVKGSGGVRKVRWACSGKGKSGGVRVMYYFKPSAYEIWMLTLYSKSERATLAPHILKQIAEAIHQEQ